MQLGPEIRRGIAELDGEGEVVGGIIVLRSGKNALETIRAVKAKLEALKPGLPAGVEIVPVYDRSDLIERAVDHLRDKLLQEFAVVALVCLAFLLHLRSALVAVVSLPLGVLAAFLVMRVQGVNANIMSLGGIAIAIGAMVDAAIVMIENAHKKLEALGARAAAESADGDAPAGAQTEERWRSSPRPPIEVGPALFFSLLIITLSFIPDLRTGSAGGPAVRAARLHQDLRDGRFGGVAVTLVPVLMGYVIRGRIPARAGQSAQPVADRRYRPRCARCCAARG